MIIHNGNIEMEKEFSEKILDKGLSIYEVFRVFRGKVIFLNDNLERLKNSIYKSHLDVNADYHIKHIPDNLNLLIKTASITEGNIKYVLHASHSGINEYFYMIPYNYPHEKDYVDGVNIISYHAERDNAEVKYINNELRNKTDILIKDNHVFEILLVNRNDFVTEGSRSNIFFIKGTTLYTPPLPYVLPGTSRKRVIEICERENFSIVEELIPYSHLSEFDAAFLTGTSPLVLPINRIDQFNYDPSNKLLRQIIEHYLLLLS